MFIDAIEKAQRFTRPVHSIVRNYGSTLVQPGAASLFFINAEGWAFTCSHVAKQLIAGDQIAIARQEMKNELDRLRGQKKEKQIKRELERKYGFSKNMAFELYNRFVDCIEGSLNFEIKLLNFWS